MHEKYSFNDCNKRLEKSTNERGYVILGEGYTLFKLVTENKLFQALAVIIVCFLIYRVMWNLINDGKNRYENSTMRVMSAIFRIIMIIVAAVIILHIFDIDVMRYLRG